MKQPIWYPNTTSKTWLQIYPTFKDDLPLSCICGRLVNEVTPFVTKHSVGISTGRCSCGVNAAVTVCIPKNKQLAEQLTDILLELGK